MLSLTKVTACGFSAALAALAGADQRGAQSVGIVLTSPDGVACARYARGWICEAAAPAPKVAAEIFRNLRRERASMADMAFSAGIRFPEPALRTSNCMLAGLDAVGARQSVPNDARKA